MKIEVRDIRKSFGSFVALDRVSLKFLSGELTALLGPSGCGKTTLLRLIAGLEVADTGQVLLQGEDATSTPARERHVGFVFQHYALFRHMSSTTLPLACASNRANCAQAKARSRNKVRKLLELVQLAPLSDRLPSQLSGGQRQRIALARALAVEPRVLLLDEPFGALDAKVRKELRRWLRQLHDELHITSIFVTHDQEEALELADRVVLMARGRVEQVGTPKEVYDRPATPFVYGFLGAVNHFRGHIEGDFVQVGGASLRYSANGFTQGARVQGFARPYELKIKPEARASEGIAATVTRILEFGAISRVELSGNGAGPQHFEVELPREQIAALNLSINQRVQLVPSNLSVFEQESAS